MVSIFTLLVQNKNEKILNLNDCEINTTKRIQEVMKVMEG